MTHPALWHLCWSQLDVESWIFCLMSAHQKNAGEEEDNLDEEMAGKSGEEARVGCRERARGTEGTGGGEILAGTKERNGGLG